MSTLAKLKEIIYEQSSIDPACITEKATLVVDLGMDSLDIVEMCVAVEDEWGVRIADEEMTAWGTVADVLKSIEKGAGANLARKLLGEKEQKPVAVKCPKCGEWSPSCKTSCQHCGYFPP